jgi:hypothetical protein
LRSLAGLILEIDIRERLPVVVADDKASVQFFDGPRLAGAGVAFFLFVIEPRRKIYDYDPRDLR